MASSRRWTMWCILLFMLVLAVSFFTGGVEAADVEIHGHTAGGLVSGHWELNVTVLGAVERVRMTVDGGVAVDMERTSPGRYTTLVDTFPLNDGDHVVEVEAFDDRNETDRVVITVVVDNTPPEIEVQWPERDDVTHSFEVNVSVTDEHVNGSVAWVEVSAVDINIVHLARGSGGFVGVIEIKDLENGTTAFRVVVTDRAGNRAVSGTKVMEVRRLPDLVLFEVGFRDSDPLMSGLGNYSIFFEVGNTGYSGTGPFDVVLLGEGGAVVRTHVDRGLSIGEMRSGTIRWWAQSVGTFNLTIVVDPDDAIEELDETNNEDTLSRTIAERESCASAMMVIMVPVVAGMIVTRRKYTPPRQ